MEEQETKVIEEKHVDVKELRAAFPNDAEFALDAIERELSVVEAKAEYADILLSRNADLAEELAELKAAVEDAGDDDGEIPVEYREEQVQEFAKDTPEAEFNALCKKNREQFGMSESDAIRYTMKENKELADKLI